MKNYSEYRKPSLNERMENLNQEGTYVGNRTYGNYGINLYTMYGFFFEVWYDNDANKITKIQHVDEKVVELLYIDRINLNLDL